MANVPQKDSGEMRFDNSRPWQSGNFPEFDNVYPSLRTTFQNYRGVTVTRGETVLR